MFVLVRIVQIFVLVRNVQIFVLVRNDQQLPVASTVPVTDCAYNWSTDLILVIQTQSFLDMSYYEDLGYLCNMVVPRKPLLV